MYHTCQPPKWHFLAFLTFVSVLNNNDLQLFLKSYSQRQKTPKNHI